MTTRERIARGALACLNEDGADPDRRGCANCPYREQTDCVEAMFRDIIKTMRSELRATGAPSPAEAAHG